MAAARPPLVVLALLAAALLTAGAVALGTAGRPTPQVAAAAAAPAGSRTAAVAVLADWDRRRAAAWAGGDPAALARLYLPGSRAGRSDVAMLERWRARGLRVTGLRMQVLAVSVRGVRGARWELEVTDRVAGGTAVGADGAVSLPRDGWSTRRIALERYGGQWRVASVRPVPARPAAPR